LVNAAAFTHVDRCEREPETAHRVNAAAPTLLASECRERGVRLVHVSTDYVFDGRGSCPYREDDPTAPRSAYGRTKLEGERGVLEASDAFLVVRTSWVYGQGRNFIEAILSQAEARRGGSAEGPLRVVDDQWGQPTYASDLAPALCELAAAGARGVVHVTGGGVATWWDVARAALDEAGYPDLVIDRIATSELQVDAPRPAWSVLDCSRAESLGVRLRAWREALADYLRCRGGERS
jgi:dTDP-4-dehydrorhamnose reductase